MQSLQVVQSEPTQRTLNQQGDLIVENYLKPRFSLTVHVVYYCLVQFKAVLLKNLPNTISKLFRLV